MTRRSFKKEPRSAVFEIGSDDAKSEIVELIGDPSPFPEDLKNFLLQQQPEASGHHENIETSSPSHRSSSETAPASSDKGLEILGRGVKELVQAVKKLRHLGIEDLLLPLPKIVVVGDQSTGKSSLIEGMSEIKVPRDIGTCTRCPLEINLSECAPGDVWVCKISLFKRYIYEGKVPFYNSSHSAKADGATRGRPLGPWTLQDGEDFLFATVHSKEEVVSALKLAQLATLNPSSPYEVFMPGQADPGDRKQVKFSPNIVRLEISGPGLPNLSFFDLPGVINVPEKEDERYLVDLVKNLVAEYIKDPSCINILAIPMTDDPANSTAFNLIGEAKAKSRTVGVLTKPDRVQSGESFNQWIDVLDGRKYKLGLGYFAIKNNPNVDVDHATARQEEREFFAEHPWATDLKHYSGRFGTLRLQTALSHELTAKIKANLPRIILQVEQKAALIEAELKTIPSLPAGNLPMKVLEKIIAFEVEIKAQVDGGSHHYPFQKNWNQLVAKFRDTLTASRPKLPRPQTQPTQYIPIDDSEDGSPESPLSGKKRRQNARMEVSPRKKLATKQISPDKRKLSDIPVFAQAPMPQPSARVLTLDDIRNIIQDAQVGLPGQIDPRATARMIRASQDSWDQPLKLLLDETEELCQNMIIEKIGQVFGDWQQTGLYAQILDICNKFLEKHMNQQRQAADRARVLELHKPLAFNSAALKVLCDSARAEIKASRRELRATELVEKSEAKNLKATNVTNFNEKLAKVTDAQLGPDPYNKEVELIGDVRGYYEYAYSRFIDVIGQGIQAELLSACRTHMSEAIKDGIGLMSPDANERCAALLEVDAENRQRRIHLTKEMQKIREAQSRLEGLMRDVPDVMASV